MICQGCGQTFDLPAGYSRNKIQCPGCGVICAVPADGPRSARTAAPQPDRREKAPEDPAAWLLEPPATGDDPPLATPAVKTPAMELVAPAVADDEDDASPYLFADKDHPPCPRCRRDMLPDAVLCTHCGFDLRQGKRVERTYDPLHYQWVSDLSLAGRIRWLVIFQIIHWSLALISFLAAGMYVPFLVTWPFLVGYTVFILGTYDQITLTRDRRGRCRLTKQWFACFVPLAPVTTEIRGYEGVTTGAWHDAGMLEWLIFASLLLAGIITGLIWYYYAIYRTYLHVALVENHGHPTLYVYRGQNSEQMEEIAEALCRATGLARLG